MPEDWKTIRVPQDVYDDAKQRKEEHGVTWGEYVNPHAWHSVFDEPTDAPVSDRLTATVKAEDMRPVIREELADAMSEVEITVNVDGDADVSEEDVRNIVESRIDRLKENLR